MDTISTEERSAVMRRVRATNTGPERVVRRLVSSLDIRYRLHRADLPGRPDLVFPSRRRVIFVHGCFWHRHARCPLARIPKSRVEFWTTKLEGNRLRDLRHRRALRKHGWEVLVVWECELRDEAQLLGQLRAFLQESKHEGR